MELLTYLGKVSIGLIALYVVYWGALRWHTYFQFNRFYLLVATLISLLVPFITFTETVPAPVATTFAYEPTQPIATTYTPEKPSIYTPENIALCIYWIGVFVMLIRLAARVKKLSNIIGACHLTKTDTCTLAYTDNATLSSFSFFNYLVINPAEITHFDDSAMSTSPVIMHELVHIRQKHSWDLIWIEILQAFCWFNPILIFYKRALKALHEFIADDLATNGNRLDYARALAGYALGVSPQVLTNNFFDISQLKQRIAMLTKNRSSRHVLGRYLFALPVLGLMIGLLATRQIVVDALPTDEEIIVSGTVKDTRNQPLVGVSITAKEIDRGTTTDKYGKYLIKLPKNTQVEFSLTGYGTKTIVVEKANIDIKLYKSTQLNELVVMANRLDSLPDLPPTPPTKNKSDVEVEKPQFPGGMEELYKYLAKNMRYPAAAIRANIQGTIIVEFVVNNEGYVENPRLVNKIDFGCDEEAMRLVLNMPKWEPAKIKGKPISHSYYLPIRFELESPTSEVKNLPTITVKNGIGIVFTPLYFINNKEMTHEDAINFKPENIESIQLLKGEQAVKMYGERGKDGVIFITTKNSISVSSWGIGRKEEIRGNIQVYDKKINVVVKEGELIGSINGKELDGKPLFVVNGKQMSANEAYQALKEIPPSDYQSYYVTKDQNYVKSLGEAAKDGIVLITTKKPKVENTPIKSDSIYNIVQIQPMFLGGQKAMYEYIRKNLKYPETAKRARVEGNVFLNFTVKKDGTIGDLQILKGLGFGCDEEAVKLVLKMPAWTPGKNNGEAVNVRYNLPITFNLNTKRR